MRQSSYHILIFSTLIAVGLTTNLANAETKFNNIKIAELQQENYSYVGLSYESTNLPRGLKDLGGWILGAPYASKEYAMSHIAKGSQEMLWLEILTTDKYGRIYHEVLDVLKIPKLNKSEGINSFCLFKGVSDPEITVIAKYQNTEYLKNIKQAWRANRNSGKFEQISTKNIACQNPGWGV